MAFLDTQGLQYVRQACDKRYLLLSGGTMTGTLHSRETGCSWIDSRNTDNSAIHFRSIPDADGNVYCPYLGGKTSSGHTWTLGGYQNQVGINVIRSDRTINGTDADCYFNTLTGQTYSSGGFKGNLEGNASSATKLTSNAGSANQPVYFSDGKPVACTSYANASVNYASSAGSVEWTNVKNRPSIPSVGNGTVTIYQNSVSKGSFTMNQSGGTDIYLSDTNTGTAYSSTSPISISGSTISLNTVGVNKGGTGSTSLGAKPGHTSTTNGWALNNLGICAGTSDPPDLAKGCFYVKYS